MGSTRGGVRGERFGREGFPVLSRVLHELEQCGVPGGAPFPYYQKALVKGQRMAGGNWLFSIYFKNRLRRKEFFPVLWERVKLMKKEKGTVGEDYKRPQKGNTLSVKFRKEIQK